MANKISGRPGQKASSVGRWHLHTQDDHMRLTSAFACSTLEHMTCTWLRIVLEGDVNMANCMASTACGSLSTSLAPKKSFQEQATSCTAAGAWEAKKNMVHMQHLQEAM
ncbi:unnamed protein product [Ostreobium quekettii]|uniref:Uncharacterized protein n=1 Tax=Ostreobium quekettii TaxID=121088 RepID=A0A8S1IZH0_9CHLO|nr:unnamed protein product [Ostreobium quekettii]